jgi:hypothetical protein
MKIWPLRAGTGFSLELENGGIIPFAKTPTETKNGSSLGREGLNTIVASKQHEDFGGQEPACARSAHMDGRKVDPK